MFETFSEDLMGLKTLNVNVFVMGDINARMGEMCDNICLDDETPALPVRENKDEKVNNNGRQLLSNFTEKD